VFDSIAEQFVYTIVFIITPFFSNQETRNMQFKIIAFAAFAASPALAFTNGSIVPAYICNPKNDGLPKNFGQVLQLTREQTTKVGFNTNSPSLHFSLSQTKIADHEERKSRCSSTSSCQTRQLANRKQCLHPRLTPRQPQQRHSHQPRHHRQDS
jgi:hypothetical protein